MASEAIKAWTSEKEAEFARSPTWRPPRYVWLLFLVLGVLCLIQSLHWFLESRPANPWWRYLLAGSNLAAAAMALTRSRMEWTKAHQQTARLREGVPREDDSTGSV